MKKEVVNSKKKKVSNRSEKELKEKEDICLYSCDTEINSDEYLKMIFDFPGYKLKAYLRFVSKSTFFIICLIILGFFQGNDFFVSIGIFIFIELIALIFDLINFRKNVIKEYENSTKNPLFEPRRHNEFYEDYCICKGEIVSIKMLYSDIDRSVETDSNFYLQNRRLKTTKIIIKKDCSLELINFIRKKFPNMENNLGNEQKIKKRVYNPRLIKYGMLLLFFITLISLRVAYQTKDFLDELMFEEGFDYTKNMWVFWCWLPIPITSIVLGIKYKLMGYKCTKNIVVGAFIGSFLLVYGLFWLFSSVLA